MALFDITANSSLIFLNQTNSNATSVSDIVIHMNGVNSVDQLPMAICVCDEGYRSRTDLYQFRADEYSNCSTSESTVLGILITCSILSFMTLLLSSVKLNQWWKWHRAVTRPTIIPMSKPVPLQESADTSAGTAAPHRFKRAKPATKSRENLSLSPNPSVEGRFRSINFSARVAPSPQALSFSSALSPNLISPRTSDLTAEGSPSELPLSPSGTDSNSKPILSGLASPPNLSRPQSTDMLVKKSISANSRHVVKPARSRLLRKHMQMLQFVHPLCCFFSSSLGVIGYLIRLSTSNIFGRDIGLSVPFFLVYQFSFLSMCIAQYHNTKLTVNMLGKKFQLKTKRSLIEIMIIVKRILFVGMILNAFAGVSLFVIAIPDIDQFPPLMVLATVGNAPFLSIGFVSIYTAGHIRHALDQGLSTLNQAQQNDRMQVKRSITRYTRQVVFTICTNCITTASFVCVAYLRLYQEFFMLLTCFLFVFVGCARMMLLKMPAVDGKQSLSAPAAKEKNMVKMASTSHEKHNAPTSDDRKPSVVKQQLQLTKLAKESASVPPAIMSESHTSEKKGSTLSSRSSHSEDKSLIE